MEGRCAYPDRGGRGFPRATRGWKAAVLILDPRPTVSPALRGDGRGDWPGRTDRCLFPPRYAGMEGQPLSEPAAGWCFPRATRGWKRHRLYGGQGRGVSPALRGDGRPRRTGHRVPFWFPPRYAGMEGVTRCRRPRSHCFPRATRGWKGNRRPPRSPLRVSPALRGDGRPGIPAASAAMAFPPRYAGMEGARARGVRRILRFPRATRGWKDDWGPSL